MTTPRTAADAAAVGGPHYTSPRFLERLKRKLAFLMRFGWVPILGALIGSAAAGGIVYVMPPTYVSTGRIWESEKLRLSDGASFTEDSSTYFATQIELLQSERMQQLAIESLQRNARYRIPLGADSKPMPARIKAAQEPRSAVVRITASSANAEYSQGLLNGVLSSFQSYRRSVRQSVSGMTYESIADQVKRLESELKSDQDALASFQKSHNLAILQEEGAISGSCLARLRTQLSETTLEAQLLETATQHLETTNSGRVALAAYALKTHVVCRLGNRNDAAEPLSQDTLRNELVAAAEVAKLRTASIQAGIAEWEAKVKSSKALIAEAARLTANVNRSQNLFDRLDRLKESVDLTRSINQDSLVILEQASPAERSYEKEVSCLWVGSLVGFVFGLGLVLFVIERRNDRFWSAREVQARFGACVVGQLPNVGKSDLHDKTEESEWVANGFRRLRSLLLAGPAGAEHPKVICITSALANEGKSTVAINLARMAVQGSARVLLVDADMDGGSLHEALGLKAEPGLAESLQGPAHSDVIQKTGTENLHFVARGKAQTDGADLLMRRALDEFVVQSRASYDLVIMDTRSVLGADDANTLAPRIDGTLFVVGRRQAGLGAVRESLKLLAQRRTRVLGLVFNRSAGPG